MATELEGTILSEIYHGADTAFRVRRAFELSPYSEWSGSSGAVYPAINRMVSAGYIVARETGEPRRTKKLSLTPLGQAAMMTWASDAVRAVAIGIDPFILRASLWQAMDEEKWRPLRAALEAALQQSNQTLEAYAQQANPAERPGVELAQKHNALRAKWLVNRGRPGPSEEG